MHLRKRDDESPTKRLAPWEAHDLIGQTPTKGAERAVLLAALKWANPAGELWPSAANWAQQVGLTPRALQRTLRRLVERGIVEVVTSSVGGAGRTSRYRIPILDARNPDRGSGLEAGSSHATTPTVEPRTPTVGTGNPDRGAPKPRPTVTPSTRNQPTEQPTTGAGVVVALLSEELRKHPNATPERLAWIAREAPNKDNPSAWAASCVRGGWAAPPPTPEDQQALKREARHQRLAAFDALPPDQQRPILDAAFRAFPNLAGRDPSDSGVRGAVAKVLEGRGR